MGATCTLPEGKLTTKGGKTQALTPNRVDELLRKS